jgi:hypothetical protein
MAPKKRRTKEKKRRKKKARPGEGQLTPIREDQFAIDLFRRLYCSQEARAVPESYAPAIVHLNRLMRVLYQTHNDELVATFGESWREYAFLWGPMREMLVLAIHSFQVAFGLLVSGYPREAKAMARSALETSIDIQFIAQDPKVRFLAYILATLDQHEKKLQAWSNVLGAQPSSEYTESRTNVAGMLAAVGRQKAQWRTTMGKWGVPSEPAWQSNAFERFRATGNEVMYRSTYAMLCSDTHMDATEIINVMSLLDYPDDSSRRAFHDTCTEDTYGNLIVVLSGVLGAVRSYATAFKLPAICKAVDADGTFIVKLV